MIRIAAMQRRSAMTASAFRQHWQAVHAPLMAQVRGIRYVQNLVVEQIAPAGGMETAVAIDGFARIDFASDDDMRAAATDPASALAGKDLANFAGATARFLCETVGDAIAAPPPDDAAKVMAVLSRRSELADDRSAKLLAAELAGRTSSLSDLLCVRQNIVTGMLPIPDTRLAALDLNAVCISEFWFARSINVDEAMRAVQKLAPPRVSVSAFAVEETRVAP